MSRIAIIKRVAASEGFSPVGLYRTIRDMLTHPDLYGEEYTKEREQEMFGEYPEVTFVSMRLEEARAAELEKEQESVEEEKITWNGFQIRKVIRWMGGESWSYAEAKYTLKHLDIQFDKSKIIAELDKGKAGKVGAKLSEEDIDTLYEIMGTL